MLKNIVKEQRTKAQEWQDNLINKHVAHAVKMRKAKEIIEQLGEGYIKLSMKFEDPTSENIRMNYLPQIVVDNIMGIVNISNASFNEQGEIENIWVGGLGLFALMGEKHTMESFFEKIARYLK